MNPWESTLGRYAPLADKSQLREVAHELIFFKLASWLANEMCNPYPAGVSLSLSFLSPVSGHTIKINRKFSNAQFWWSLIIFASVCPLSPSLPVLSPVPSAVDMITIINLARDYAYICLLFSLSHWWFFCHAKIIPFWVYFGFLLPFSFLP